MKDKRAYNILVNSRLFKELMFNPQSEMAVAMQTALLALREKVEDGDMVERENWYFTFGLGSKRAYKYVVIHGTYDEARDRMFDMYGADWAFQYDEKTWLRSKCSERYTEIKTDEVL